MTDVAELETAIRANPDDVDLRAVHADALLERGAPGDRQRGQLIQLALAAERGDAEAAKTVRELQRKAKARLVKGAAKFFVVRVGWRYGSVDSIKLDRRGWGTDTSLPMRKLNPVIDLLAQPELFALRGFDARVAGTTNVETVVDLVRHLPIRWLGVTAGEVKASDLDLLHTLPQLAGVGLVTNTLATALDALAGRPWLRDLEIAADHDAPALIAEACPQLTRLVLFGVRALTDDLAAILDRRALGELRDLGLMSRDVETTSRICRRLVGGPLLPALRSFGFCASTVYDAPDLRDWFLANREAFAQLRLFTGADNADWDRGHDAGRLGMLLDDMSREADAIEEQAHHLDHSGGEEVHAGCWARLANDLIQVDHYSEALHMVDRGIAAAGHANSNAAYLWRTRLHALDFLERYSEALVASDHALAVDGECSWTWRYRGAALRELGRFDDAAEALDRAVELAKDNEGYRTWAHLLRGELRWGRRDHAAATEDFEHILATSKDTAACRRSQLGLGSIAYQRGDLAAARPHFVEALSRSSYDDSDAISSLCFTLFELEHYELALTTWQIAAKQFDWNDIDEQGHVLIALGRPADALTTLATGREVGGARAMALHALGRIDEAIAAVDDYADRSQLVEPACAARLAIGGVLQGLLLRAAGREREAKQRFAKLRSLPDEPGELHAALLRRLRGHDTSCCHADSCERPAAAAAIAAALARGEVDDATRRARVLGSHVERKLANRVPVIEWDLRSIHRLAPSELLQATLAVVERCAALE